jgi:hypothetical protein
MHFSLGLNNNTDLMFKLASHANLPGADDLYQAVPTLIEKLTILMPLYVHY